MIKLLIFSITSKFLNTSDIDDMGDKNDTIDAKDKFVISARPPYMLYSPSHIFPSKLLPTYTFTG